jgi:RNA polymerase sigma factor (sigma-70 family)
MSEPGTDCAPRRGLAKTPNNLTIAERQKLVESCIHWCRKAARARSNYLRKLGQSVDAEALESEAYIACCQAAEFWRDSQGATFLTYARHWINNRLRAVTDARKMIVPGNMLAPELVPDSSTEDGYIPSDGRPNRRTQTAEDKQRMATLTDEERAIVLAIAFDGLRPEQVAEQMGRPVRVVKLIMRNAVEAMNDHQTKRDAQPAQRAVDCLAALELAVEGLNPTEAMDDELPAVPERRGKPRKIVVPDDAAPTA